MDKANLRENRNRVDYGYIVGQEVYIKNGIQRKMDCPKQSPYKITEVFTDGLYTIVRCESGDYRISKLHQS